MYPAIKRTIVSLQFSVLIILSQDVENVKSEIYSSIDGLKGLVKAEQGIIEAIHEYISSLENRLRSAKAYLQDQEENMRAIADARFEIKTCKEDRESCKSFHAKANMGSLEWQKLAEFVSSHPLRTYRMIRRFVTNLPQLEKELHMDYEKNVLRVIDKVRKIEKLPDKSDLEAATQGLLRVQDAYNYDINEFTEGNFEGLKTNSSLNAADCHFIGVYSLRANVYTRAIEWLQRAYFLNQEVGDESISSQEARDRLEEAILSHNQAFRGSAQQSTYLYREPVENISAIRGPVKRRTRMLDKQTHKLYQKQASFMDLLNFAELCRGGQLQSATARKNLKCYYDRNSPLNRISPLKVEVLHKDPQVLQIYDVLTDQLIDEILFQAQPSLSRSKVHGQGKGQKVVSASRTSTSTWLKNSKIGKLSSVYDKMQSLLKMDMRAKGACEDFQVTNYAITGHYNPHQDNILSSEIAPGMNAEEFRKGDRISTLMFYLSDVLKGGWTVFPRLGISAIPVKGSAIFWFNMKTNGEPEPLSLHGGCPVVFGNKWIANQWIRANSQMFTRKCTIIDKK